MNQTIRIIALMCIDVIFIALAVLLALVLRFEGDLSGQYVQYVHNAIYLLPYYIILTIAFMHIFRLYHRMWQYASIGELYGILKATTSSSVLIVMCIYTINLPHLPRSVYILSWLLISGFIGGSRLGWRILREYLINQKNSQGQNTLIIGAGDGGVMVARELLSNKNLNLTPVGFIDDNRYKQKLAVYDVPVLGRRRDIPTIVKEYQVEEIIIAIPSASGRTIREIMEICRQTQARVRIFQGTNELLADKYDFREVQLEDLLRREPVQLNLHRISGYIQDKIVLVSGAGGSIGSELCRQISMFAPKELVLVEYSENNLFQIELELREVFPGLTIHPELVDIKDKERLQKVFKQHQPQVVFHAAAYKHVPMMEKHPRGALRNNVIGTKNMAELADQYAVETFIFISTDKAVQPTSVMGATKRIGELIIQEINSKSEGTNFAAVRFGNVLGSSGSVIPIFEKQIKKGGPVTVTDAQMTRYFMTIPEAVQLVIQAGAMAQGGEIFVLDMGEPVKILDLAADLIRLHGLEPDKDIKIEITGIRPGEKLYEELFNANESMTTTYHDRILVSENGHQSINVLQLVDKLIVHNAFLDTADAIDIIRKFLPQFRAEGSTSTKQEIAATTIE
jgi:FlaA1/EpsC-like NDP-sugar epimerase